MKKILNHSLYLSLFIMIVALLSACKKDVEKPPVISEVRSYVVTPNDTVINGLIVNNQIKDGQWVVISGQNLKNAVQIKFNGVNALGLLKKAQTASLFKNFLALSAASLSR